MVLMVPTVLMVLTVLTVLMVLMVKRREGRVAYLQPT